MEFKEFREKAEKALKEDKEMAGFNIELRPCEKLNGQSYDALVVCEKDSCVGVSINLNRMYECFDHEFTDDCISYIKEYACEGLAAAPVGATDLLDSYDAIKGKLILELISLDRNLEMLSGIPYIKTEDLALIARIAIGENSEGFSSAVVTNDMLKTFEISKEELFKDAFKAASLNAPAKLQSMASVIREITGMDETEIPESSTELMVLSNGTKNFGASALLYPGMLEMVSEKVGGNFVVLPSSIHEVIILGDPGFGGYEDLASMVREINANEVAESDKLTDSVYLYEAAKHELKRVC